MAAAGPIEPPSIGALADVLRQGAHERPLATAIECANERATWRDLHGQSRRVAQGLVAEGLLPSDRVAFLGRSSIAFFELLFGAAMAGVVTIPLNWRLTGTELAVIVADSGAKLLFVSAEFEPLVRDMATAEKVIVIGGAGGRASAYDQWVAARPAEDPGLAGDPRAAVLQLYTSGTTGIPKGVMLTGANIAGYWAQGRLFGFDAASINLVTLPLFHIAGIWWALVGMAQGARTILTPDFSPELVLDIVPRLRITHVVLVPAILLALTRHRDIDDTDFSSLRTVMYGASPIGLPLLDRCLAIFDCNFFQTYGLSETSGAVTLLAPEDHEARHEERLRSVGRPLAGVEIRIVDPATRIDAADGVPGEIWIRSDQVMQGYWQREAETAATIVENGWLRTGDIACVRDGYLFLCDRLKDMIVTGGENVYPTEVENVLMAHPGVADVAVIGVPSSRWGEEVKAIVVPAGHDPDAAAILAFARERLAGYKCPKSVEFLPGLPRTSSGKILKRELREPYWKGHARRIA